jgi:hypothetical protein
MTDKPSELEYRNEVESTAETILDHIEEYPEDYGDDPWKAIHETVDWHEYVQKYHLFLPVLQHAESNPEEWNVYVKDGETNHWKVLEAMAYTAFRADVANRVFDLAEERGVDLD